MQKTKIEDHMLLSQQDRQLHLDLSTECQYHTYTKQYNHNGTIKQIGDLYSKKAQKQEAKKNLLDFHNIEDFSSSTIHTCHKCSNDSGKDKVCVSPLHTYFGTVSENNMDKPEDVRKEATSEAGKIGTKSKLESGNHVSQTGMSGFDKKDKCKYCFKESNIANIERWHNENCKSKP